MYIQKEQKDEGFTSVLNFKSKGQCCFKYTDLDTSENGICIRDSPHDCFKQIEEIGTDFLKFCYKDNKIAKEQQKEKLEECPREDSGDEGDKGNGRTDWENMVLKVSESIIKKLVAIRIRYNSRKEVDRVKINDTINEITYDDDVIGIEYDEDITLVEQYKYKVNRNENSLKIYKKKIEGYCEIEGLCGYYRMNETQNL